MATPPQFSDGKPMVRNSPTDARNPAVSKEWTRRGMREARALALAMLGKATGFTAHATYPYVVQATDGKTGGLVTIGSKDIVNRVTISEDKENLEDMLNRPTHTVILPYSGAGYADDTSGIRMDADVLLNVNAIIDKSKMG